MKSLIVLLVYSLIGSSGLFFMKKGLSNLQLSPGLIKSPVFMTGFLCYSCSFVLWLFILKKNELSYAFPIASAALFMFSSLFSVFLLNEHLSNARIAGMVIIVLGIFLVAKG